MVNFRENRASGEDILSQNTPGPLLDAYWNIETNGKMMSKVRKDTPKLMNNHFPRSKRRAFRFARVSIAECSAKLMTN